MEYYKTNESEVKAWLNAGGSEIVFEAVRRMGWNVCVTCGGDWSRTPETVAMSSRCAGYEGTCVNGEKSGYEQAVAVVAAFIGIRSYLDWGSCSRAWEYPTFKTGDDIRMFSFDLRSILRFCDIIRSGYEAAVSLLEEKVQE